VRKFSSIDNTVNNLHLEDRSADLSNRTFRKFSHSKNTSVHAVDSLQQKPCNGNNMDLMF
jgi:hypothetical protein